MRTTTVEHRFGGLANGSFGGEGQGRRGREILSLVNELAHAVEEVNGFDDHTEQH